MLTYIFLKVLCRLGRSLTDVISWFSYLEKKGELVW